MNEENENEVVVDTAATFQAPPNWPLCDPSFVLEKLHSLKADKCFEGKAFFSTYPKSWEKLTADRRMKTIVFFGKQSIGVQTALRYGAMALELAKSIAESDRSANTTKDDRCR